MNQKLYKGDVVKVNFSKWNKNKYSDDFYILETLKQLKIDGRTKGTVEFYDKVSPRATISFVSKLNNKKVFLETPIEDIKLVKSSNRHPFTKIFI